MFRSGQRASDNLHNSGTKSRRHPHLLQACQVSWTAAVLAKASDKTMRSIMKKANVLFLEELVYRNYSDTPSVLCLLLVLCPLCWAVVQTPRLISRRATLAFFPKSFYLSNKKIVHSEWDHRVFDWPFLKDSFGISASGKTGGRKVDGMQQRARTGFKPVLVRLGLRLNIRYELHQVRYLGILNPPLFCTQIKGQKVWFGWIALQVASLSY